MLVIPFKHWQMPVHFGSLLMCLGTHMTNVLSVHNVNPAPILLIPTAMISPGRNFANATTAHPEWHVPNLLLDWHIEEHLEHNDFFQVSNDKLIHVLVKYVLLSSLISLLLAHARYFYSDHNRELNAQSDGYAITMWYPLTNLLCALTSPYSSEG